MRRFFKFLAWFTAGVIAIAILGALVTKDEPPTRTGNPALPPNALRPPSEGPDVSAEQYGNTWPLTIPGGTLKCEPAAQGRMFVTIDAGKGRVYALNGSARQFAGVLDGRTITRRQNATHTGPVADRVSETIRQRTFADIVRCEEVGTDSDVCSARSAKNHKLTAEEITRIRDEGLNRSWPPLDPPPPMNVEPLIRRGLALCGK